MLNYYKYYIVEDSIEYEVFPYGSFNPIMERIKGFMELKLSGNLHFSDSDIRGTNDYTYLLEKHKTKQYLDFRVKRYNSGIYENYIDCILDLMGDWNESDKTCILTQQSNSNLQKMLDNIDIEINLLSFLNKEVITADVSIYGTNKYSPCVNLMKCLENLLSYFLEKNITIISKFFNDATNPITGEDKINLYLSHKITAIWNNYSGTVISGSLTEITISELISTNIINKYVNITSGTGAGQMVRITDYTTQQIYATFDVAPDETSEYQILENAEALQINISLKDIFKILSLFNILYYFDGDNFYIEHRKYFENNLSYSATRAVGIDLTNYTLNSKSYLNKFIKNRNKIKYDVSKIVNKEIIKYQEYGNWVFKDIEIKYDNINNKKFILDLGNLSVDLDFAYRNEESSMDGIFLYAVNNSNEVISTPINISVDTFLKFTNIDYSTFVYAKNEIITAISTGINSARINNIEIVTGEKIIITFDFALNSGEYPIFSFNAHEYTVVEGVNVWEIIGAFWEFNSPIIISNTAASNWRLNNFRIEKNINTIKNNNPLSLLKLISDFWNNGRILLNGYVNGKLTTFLTKKRLKIGAKISNVPVNINTFDAEQLIKTDIGDGLIEKTDIHNGLMDFELSYE